MFLFAHMGLTLGAALAGCAVVKSIRHKSLSPDSSAAVNWPGPISSTARSDGTLTGLVRALSQFLDLRLLIIGSMLPDIIDKPLGLFLYGSGRAFMHSLAAALLLVIIAVWSYRRNRQTGWLALAFGLVCHLLFDFMWLKPAIFLWPLYGWGLEDGARELHFDTWRYNLTNYPVYIVLEAIGLALCGWVLWQLNRLRILKKVIFRGRIR